MRITTLLQKLNELSAQPDSCTAIDVDLMLDYTRVMYADLLDWRSKLGPVAAVASAPVAETTVAARSAAMAPPPAKATLPIAEPTLAEMTAAMEMDMDDDDLEEDPRLRPLTVLKTMEFTPDPEMEEERETPVVTMFNPPSRDIRSMIGINDKYQIMSELFGNDKDAYEAALNRINQSGNETEAMSWLEERLWVTEEHSDAAQSFYELVRRFFN